MSNSSISCNTLPRPRSASPEDRITRRTHTHTRALKNLSPPDQTTKSDRSPSRVRGKDEDYFDPDLDKSILRALDLIDQQGLLDFKDLPEPWRMNYHIVHGYYLARTNWDLMSTPFRLTNESFNVWSHGLGILLVAAFPIIFTPLNNICDTSTSFIDWYIAALYFGSAAGCMLCSTIWHIGKCHSNASVAFSCVSVDMMGISLILAASISTTEYLAFYANPFWQRFYVLQTLVLGIAGIVLPWTSFFRRHDLAYFQIDTAWVPWTRVWSRVIFFGFLCLQGIFLPMAHLSWARGKDHALEFYSFLLPMYLPIAVGTCFYATKFPEMWYPGTFDFIGSSHNLWHVAVLVGMYNGCVVIAEMFAFAQRHATTLK